MKNIKMHKSANKKIDKIITYKFNEAEVKLICDLINERYERIMKKYRPDMKMIDELNKLLEKVVSQYK